MTADGWFTRFPPSDAVLAACNDVVSQWRETHGVRVNLEEATWKLAARVNSWLGPKSVQAGVGDVIGGRLGGEELPDGALDQLGERLARRLLEEGLLGRREVPKPAVKPLDFGNGTQA
jgi:hypothetical protein